MARYVQISVNSGARWPDEQQNVLFGGREVILVPPRRDETGQVRAFPMAAVEYASGEHEPDIVRLVRRFLNALAWREQVYIREVGVTYGAPLREGTRIPDNFTTDRFDAADLPDPSDDKARIALAFYREGLDLDHVHRAYSFLSFFKVLNVRHEHGPAQKRWINESHGKVRNADALHRLKEIAAAHTDVGAYLYESGRCAVAHAFSTPIVDPNNIKDQQRLSRDWHVIRSLAALIIQEEWQIAAPRWQAAV